MVDKEMQAPVYVYYELDKFYTGHYLFAKSVSNEQLAGVEISESQAVDKCQNAATNKQMGKTQAVDGTLLDPNAVAVPCGLIAKAFFNDTYALFSVSDETEKLIRIDSTDILWVTETDYQN